MLEIRHRENIEVLPYVVFAPLKYNRTWGADYLLMDSKGFEGQYDNLIGMFMNMWNTWEYRVFTNN